MPHAGTKIFEQGGVVLTEVEVTLHLVDEGFLIRSCLERSRHPQDFTITGAFRVKGGVAASEGPGDW